MKRIIITFLMGLLISSAMAAADEYHYIATSSNGKNVYDITIKPDLFSWKGIAGVDKGQFSADPCKHLQLSNSVDVIQWQGKKYHTFNTMIIDHDNLKYIYSSLEKKGRIFDDGKLEQAKA